MLHLDEARNNAAEALEEILGDGPKKTKAVLIDDLFGKLRLVLWAPKPTVEALRQQIDARLGRVAGAYWTGEIWLAQGEKGLSEADQMLYNRAWDEAQKLAGRQLRLLNRRRNRGAWFTPASKPVWKTPRSAVSSSKTKEPPPIVIFYSFKGGVGRSTALASFAIQRARAGERVVAIDADLDAPGLGALLDGADGATAAWGVVDYLLERPLGEVELRDYYHACRREAVTGSGEILVFPAGKVEVDYLEKLARLDLEPDRLADNVKHPFKLLLEQIRDELGAHWILIDARAGLGEPAGLLLAGLAHLHVLFGTISDQSWAGLGIALERLGGDRVREGQPQADCLLVQAMVPENVEVAGQAREAFEDRARDVFGERYYAADPDAEPDGKRTADDVWNVSDATGSDAPHVPIPISYSSRLADFPAIDTVADFLASWDEYRHLGARIGSRFGVE